MKTIRKIICIGVLLVMIFSLFGCGKEFVPEPLSPEVLSEETEFKIRQYFFDLYTPECYSGRTIDDVIIIHYYGTYNGYIVVLMNGYGGSGGRGDLILGGVNLGFFGYYMTVWKDGNNYTLGEAYKKNFLRKNDLKNIAYYQGNSPEVKFEIGRVDVLIKNEFSAKYDAEEFTVEDFELDNIERIEYKSYLSLNMRMFTLYLKQHGEEYVLEAVEDLGKLDFVEYAEPKYFRWSVGD